MHLWAALPVRSQDCRRDRVDLGSGEQACAAVVEAIVQEPGHRPQSDHPILLLARGNHAEFAARQQRGPGALQASLPDAHRIAGKNKPQVGQVL